MLIVCPNCATSYEVKTEALGYAGRTVRCVQCRKEWFATPPSIQMIGAAAPPSALAAGIDRPAPAAAPLDDQVDWDAPPVPEPGQPVSSAADRTSADEDVATLWDVPQTPSPPLAPDPDTIEAGPLFSPGNVETMAARRARRTRRRLDRIELPLVPTLIAVQLVVICAGLLWRTEIVHWMPQTASFFRAIGLGVNMRGLVFADIHTSRDAHDGVTVLIIEGTIVNTTRSAVPVPRLRLALRNAALAELFSWTATPDKGILGPGEMLPFRSRLASPPADGNDILVRFLSRLDFVNGAR